jgi:hypothetical protein
MTSKEIALEIAKGFESSQLYTMFSPYTGKFYCSVKGLDLSEPGIAVGIVEHRNTPDEAVQAFWNRLVREGTVIRFERLTKQSNYKEYLTTYHLWNGFLFVETNRK